jgi:ribonuclease HII
MRWIVGVDEAGRGPLAGPVAVGAVAVPAKLSLGWHFPGLADSKKLSEKKREELYKKAQDLQRQNILRYIVVFSSAGNIDKRGIARVLRQSVWRGVSAIAPEPELYKIFLDGLLEAPKEYEQETVIRGDSLVPVISLASVLAKVSRDRLMLKYAKKFPNYGFEKHKGYGTAMHYEAIKKHGLCDIHRRTYIKIDLK